MVFSTLKLYIISNFVFSPLVTNPSIQDFGFDENPSGKHTIINGEYKQYEAVENLTVTLKERMLGVGMNAALWGLKPVYELGKTSSRQRLSSHWSSTRSFSIPQRW